MIVISQIFAFLLGLLLVLGAIASAIQTFVLPRGAVDRITSVVFRLIRFCFDILLKRTENLPA